jgi:glycosyltransferase involved in cell wall biosynthesis
MKNGVLISIVISTYNKPWETLAGTLNSVLRSTFKDYELIVVDQNEHNHIKKGIGSDEKYREVLYLKSDSRGLSKGRNLGIAHSKGQWLLFFDDDALLPDDILSRVSRVLSNNENRPVVYYGRALITGTKRPYLRKSAAMGRKISLLNFDSVCSIALLFNREVFLKAGPFDETLGAGVEYGAGEESDVILRALKNNCTVKFLPEFTVYHPPANTSDPEKRESYGKGIGALYKKHMFSSPYFFFVMGFKFLVESFLRSILILCNINSSRGRKYHAHYLKGCISGFIQYKPDNILASRGKRGIE